MNQMQTEMSESRAQLSGAKLEVKAKQNHTNGLKWQLACVHKAMAKHTTKMSKLRLQIQFRKGQRSSGVAAKQQAASCEGRSLE
jgi:hypothetical protein